MNGFVNRPVWFGYLGLAVCVAAALYAAKRLLPILDGKEQYDFRTYYYAALAFERGMDPYNIQSLREVSGRGIVLTFIYPPHVLFLLRPLCRLGYPTAYFVFLAAKLAALGMLIRMWSRIVPSAREDLWPLLITSLLGYRGATMVDLVAGNLSTFEQLLIWVGIFFLLRNRPLLGGLGVLLSSLVKLVTLALGPLVFVVGRTAKSVLAWAGLTTAFGLLYFVSYRAQSDLWSRFVSSTLAAAFYEKSDVNPSSLVLSKDLAGRLGFGAPAATVAYGAWCALVASLWLWSFRRTIGSPDRYPVLYVTILAYVLVSPKMILYSFMIALLPTLHTISAIVPRRCRPAGCFLLWVPLFDYQPLLLAAGTLATLVYWIHTNRDKTPISMSLTLNPFREC